MSTDNDPQTPHAAEGIRQLEAFPARADAGRVEGLESLGRLRTAKTAMLLREQGRLTAKYGAEHPRVQALAQQITANRLLVNHVGAEAGRATVTQVDVDPKAWILHGRVMRRDLQGHAGLTVALYDSGGAWVQSLGFAGTDSTGYFKLSAATVGTAGGTTTGAGSQPSTRRTENQPPSAPDPATPRSAGAARGRVHVHVLDSRSTTLWSDPRALHPAPGRVDYEEIVLGDTLAQDAARPDGKKPKAPTDVPPSRRTPPRAAKKPPREAKAIKPTTKK